MPKRTHGMSRSRVYSRWRGMIQRCLNPTCPRFKDYGGRGITISDAWRDFRNFFQDMGEPPAGYSLDRINNDGPYSKENCRWATTIEQANNARRRIFPPDWRPRAKLTSEQVKQVRALLATGMNPNRISKLFDVNRQTIANIKTGHTWNTKHN